MKSIKIGGRASLLSRIQISLVSKSLLSNFPNLNIIFQTKDAAADIDLETPLWKLPVTGAFTTEFSNLLINNKVDLIVHSHKDLALVNNKETEIHPVLERGDLRDLLLFKKSKFNKTLDQITILTSSPRRTYLLSQTLPELLPKRFQNLKINFNSIRGNIQTRLQKLINSEDADAIVLSKVAIDRLLCDLNLLHFDKSLLEKNKLIEEQNNIKNLLTNLFFMILPLSLCPNAPAQGSLAVEIRKDDTEILKYVNSLKNYYNTFSTNYERSELSKYGGGCHQSIGISLIETKDFIIKYKKGKLDNGIILNERIIEHKKNAGDGMNANYSKNAGIEINAGAYSNADKGMNANYSKNAGQEMNANYSKNAGQEMNASYSKNITDKEKNAGISLNANYSKNAGDFSGAGYSDNIDQYLNATHEMNAGHSKNITDSKTLNFFPNSKEDLKKIKIKRTPLSDLEIDPPNYCFVSRSEAWLDKWESFDKIIWTPGIKTMKKLAKRDIWVHGCSDGLGEIEFSSDIKNLIQTNTDKKIEFVKLTHQINLQASIFPKISTYKIECCFPLPDISSYKSFFWNSATQFDWFINAYPEIIKAKHASGPGLTSKYIEKKIESIIDIFFDFEDWLNSKKK